MSFLTDWQKMGASWLYSRKNVRLQYGSGHWVGSVAAVPVTVTAE